MAASLGRGSSSNGLSTGGLGGPYGSFGGSSGGATPKLSSVEAESDMEMTQAIHNATRRAKRFLRGIVIGLIYIVLPFDLMLGAFYLAVVSPTTAATMTAAGFGALIPTTTGGWVTLAFSFVGTFITTGLAAVFWYKKRHTPFKEVLKDPLFLVLGALSLVDTMMDIGVVTIINFGPEQANVIGLPNVITMAWLGWSIIVGVVSLFGEPLIGWLDRIEAR